MTENQLKYLAHQETSRHNAATEAVEKEKAQETARSNLAKEAETQRSNIAKESLESVKNVISANVAKETERSNKAREELQRVANQISQSGLAVKGTGDALGLLLKALEMFL